MSVKNVMISKFVSDKSNVEEIKKKGLIVWYIDGSKENVYYGELIGELGEREGKKLWKKMLKKGVEFEESKEKKRMKRISGYRRLKEEFGS